MSIPLITGPSASVPTSSAQALSLFSALDHNKSGILKKTDFFEFYSSMSADNAQSSELRPSFAIHSSFSGIQASFSLHPTFGVPWSDIKAHAEKAFQSLVTSGSNEIDKAAFMAHFGFDPTGAALAPSSASQNSSSSRQTTGSPAPSTPNSGATATDPAVSADQVLAKYDPAGKGYFNADDVAAVYTKDPTLGDPATAADVVAAWDDNRDGRVTRDELINGFTTLNLADVIMAQFDPSGTGTIDLATVSDNSASSIPNAAATLASWDSNKDGKVTRDELITGLRNLNQQATAQPKAIDDPATLFANYDTNNDGVISADEIKANTSTPEAESLSVMAAWDTNGDGTISKQEFIDGYNLIKQATGIVSQYDLSGKGYFDQSDLQAAIDSNPANKSGPSAADLMAFWDANGDGKVTVPDVLAGLAKGGQIASQETPTIDQTNLDKLYAAYGYSTGPTA